MKKNGLMLALYALIVTGLISLVYWLTADTIKQQEKQLLRTTLKTVIPASAHDNRLENSCYTVDINKRPTTVYLATSNGKPSALAIKTVAPNGYNGNIELLIGINMDGVIYSTRVLSHKETPGLGDKIERTKSDWIEIFNGEYVDQENMKAWAVEKDGGHFDQFTGATITPRAIVGTVRNTLIYFKEHKATVLDNLVACKA